MPGRTEPAPAFGRDGAFCGGDPAGLPENAAFSGCGGIPVGTGISGCGVLPESGGARERFAAAGLLGGRYWLLRPLSSGGSGSVFLARDLHLPKYWAVKRLPKSCAAQARREAALLGSRPHPGLPAAVDFLEEAQYCYLVMEYIPGMTLQEAVRRAGAFPEARCVDAMLKLAEILENLHGRRPPVWYLDMKPANVMLTDGGGVVLVDFGAAMEPQEAALRRGSCFGTYGYAPPEQRLSGVCDGRSDLYALGATAYAMLTGCDPSRPPFGIRPVREWGRLAGSGFRRILCGCLEEDPQRRIQTASELCRQLRALRRRPRPGLLPQSAALPQQEKNVFLTTGERLDL